MRTFAARFVLVALVVSLYATSAHAHGFWVNLSQYKIDLDDPSHGLPGLRAFIGFGHYYPSDEPIKQEEVTRYEVIAPDGTRTPLLPMGPGYLVSEVKPDKPGPHIIAAQYYSHFFTMYRKEGVPTYVTKPKTGIEEVRLSHHYDVFAKALLSVGDTDAEHFTQPVGDAFEIVPKVNPASLADTPAAERMLTLRVLHLGKPAVEADVRATPMGYSTKGKFLIETKTDANGEVQVALSQSGVWLVLAHKMEPATGDMVDKTDEMHYEAGLTFSVE